MRVSKHVLTFRTYTQKTGTHHEFAPTPIAVTGLQVTPTCPVTSWTAIPKIPKRPVRVGDFALWTLLQHWMAPVLHWLPEDALPAEAIAASARAVKVERAANCIVEWKYGERGVVGL